MENFKDLVFGFLIVAVIVLTFGIVIEDQLNDDLERENQVKTNLIDEQRRTIDTLETQFQQLLESLEYIDSVDATMYNAVPEQTDDTPYETASGAIINPEKASEHRWIAISRDLQQRWGGPLNFGDVVYIVGTGEHDGLYIVNDNMNPRYTRRIDILKTEGEEEFAFNDKNVKLFRVEKSNRNMELAEADIKEFNSYIEKYRTAE